MWQEISEWLQWADSTGLITFLISLTVVLYRLIHPLIQSKIQDSDTDIKVQTLTIADNLASAIVPELAIMAEMTNDERKTEAIRFVNNKLTILGLQLTDETVSAKVEKAYQEYKRADQTTTN